MLVRDDDRPDAINNRMNVYEMQTAPVLDYYRAHGVVEEIAATGSPDSVFQVLTQTIRLG